MYVCAGVVVTGLQISIAIRGKGRLEDNVKCLEMGLSDRLNYTVVIPTNSSIPVSKYNCAVCLCLLTKL